MIAKQAGNMVPPGRGGDQTNGRVENGLQALNVAVGDTSEYDVTVVEPTVYQGGDQTGHCVCRHRPLDGFNLSQSTETGRQHVIDLGPHCHGSIEVHVKVSDRLNRCEVRMCMVASAKTNSVFARFSCSLLLRVQLQKSSMNCDILA